MSDLITPPISRRYQISLNTKRRDFSTDAAMRTPNKDVGPKCYNKTANQSLTLKIKDVFFISDLKSDRLKKIQIKIHDC